MDVFETFVLRSANPIGNNEYLAYSDYFIASKDDRVLCWLLSVKNCAFQFSSIEGALVQKESLIKTYKWAKDLEVVRWIVVEEMVVDKQQ